MKIIKLIRLVFAFQANAQ